MDKPLKGIKKDRSLFTKKKIIELAKLAYFDYAVTALKNAANGNVMPQWDDLHYNQQEAWIKVVLTLKSELVPRRTFQKKTSWKKKN